MRSVVARSRTERLLQAFDRQRKISRAGKIARHDLGRVRHDKRMTLAYRTEHLLGAGDDEIAAENEIGLAG